MTMVVGSRQTGLALELRAHVLRQPGGKEKELARHRVGFETTKPAIVTHLSNKATPPRPSQIGMGAKLYGSVRAIFIQNTSLVLPSLSLPTLPLALTLPWLPF